MKTSGGASSQITPVKIMLGVNDDKSTGCDGSDVIERLLQMHSISVIKVSKSISLRFASPTIDFINFRTSLENVL